MFILSNSFLLEIEDMQLQFPTQRDVCITQTLGKKQKLVSKLAYSTKQLPHDELCPREKQKITCIIKKDKHHKLLKVIDDLVITNARQVGAPGSKWTMLHFCAQFNSTKCAKLLLKTQFAISQEMFKEAVNRQTSEGYTPVMVAIVYKSDTFLSFLLNLGGVNLNIFEKGKLKAYDLALQYRNQFAVKQLIQYQEKCKKIAFINYEELQKEDSQILNQNVGFCNTFYSFLASCFSCININDEEDVQHSQIGKSQQLNGFKVQWCKISQILGQQTQLFASFKPHDITERQFSIKNNLIIFQALSDYSWLLRKIIEKKQIPSHCQQKKITQFMVILYKGHEPKVVEVDQLIPVLKLNGQPMFISNHAESWPLILQKSLSKLYGSYLSLNELSAVNLLQTITGFYSTNIPIQKIKSIYALEMLAMRGNLVMLQGKVGTELNPFPYETLFSILTFYQKGEDKKILISCPKILKNWNEQTKNVQLTIMKSHYSRPNQSCIWIDDSKLQQYFSSAIVVFIRQDYLRKDYKVKVPQRKKTYSIFFKLKLQNESEDPIYMQLLEKQTDHRFDLSSIMCMEQNSKQSVQIQQEHQYVNELIKLQTKKGQYLCRYEVDGLLQPNLLKESDKGAKKFEVNKRTLDNIKSKKNVEESKSKRTTDQIKFKKGAEESKSKKTELSRSKVTIQQRSKRGGSDLFKKMASESKSKSKKIIEDYKVKNGEHMQNLNMHLICWSSSEISVQFIEEQFGLIEWFNRYRTFAAFNSQILSNEKGIIFQILSGRTLIITAKYNYRSALSIQFSQSRCNIDSIIEGKWMPNNGGYVEMIKDTQRNCFYCILKGIEAADCTSAIILQN